MSLSAGLYRSYRSELSELSEPSHDDRRDDPRFSAYSSRSTPAYFQSSLCRKPGVFGTVGSRLYGCFWSGADRRSGRVAIDVKKEM